MLTRRQFLRRTLQGSSLVALAGSVPGFLATSARAAPPAKDAPVLVVLEMGGGNDGLNTVAPFADEEYQKARPTLRLRRDEVVRVSDAVGLHPSLRPLDRLLQKGQLAVVQGVGYPNPDRSHFESMDIWHSADVRRRTRSGWLGRSVSALKVPEGHMPALHVGMTRLPLALQGSATATPTINPDRPFDLHLGGVTGRQQERMKLILDVTQERPPHPAGQGEGGADDLLQFVRRSSLKTYAATEQLRQLLASRGSGAGRYGSGALGYHLGLVAWMIRSGFGARLFFVSIDGFDTHSEQRNAHPNLLQQVAEGVNGFFQDLEQARVADRVLLLTFSEFGRRVRENGSRGTDHGAASCLFVAGPAARGGLAGQYPSLAPGDLDQGDLRHTLDFRQVYATLLDRWLGCDSRLVLGEQFEHVPLLRG
jgi:uncharacterized protein (DUF1501 family)